MRVAFYTNSTSQGSLVVLKQLAESHQAELVHVIFYDTMREARKSPLKILKEFGFRRLAAKAMRTFVGKFRTLLIRSPLRHLIRPATAYEFVLLNRVPYRVVDNLNSIPAQEKLRNLNLDLLLVCICKNILKEVTLRIPRLGTINIHPSLLPKYRGPMPIFWMLYHGDSQGGVTFQQMTAKVDDGPIIAQYETTLNLNDSEEMISHQLFELAGERLHEVLAMVQQNKLQAVNPASDGNYFSFPTAQQNAELRIRRRSRTVA